MRLSARQYIFYLALAVACGYANAGAVAKRAAGDTSSSGGGLSGMVNSIVDSIRSFPLIGSSIAGIIDWFMQMLSMFEIGTNGALARLLGGALPCTVSLDGTVCTGLTNNGGFVKVLMDVLDGIPSLILPGFIKSLLQLAIHMFINPTVDVVFGGNTVTS